METRRMYCKVELQEKELVDYGRQMCEVQERLDNLRTQKSVYSGEMAGQIKKAEMEVSSLAKIIRGRHVEREVEVEDIYDRSTHEIVTQRCDTFEEICRRMATDEEREKALQPVLPFESGEADAEEDKAEGATA